MDNSNIITNYAKLNEHICLCCTISICLILIFILSPMNNYVMVSVIGKIFILLLLSYTVFYNVYLTNRFSNQINEYLDNNNSISIKTNIICSYIFSLFLFILIVSVIRSFF
jgi:hypothetical protein